MKQFEERAEKGHPLGVHRVLDSTPGLPQSAERLDNQLPIFSNEICIQVECLNIDAASFVQMEKETGGDTRKIADIILENCRTRGKQQNRVTGSGGMLLGQVSQIGSQYKGKMKFKVGDRIATMISLTLTPLHIEKIKNIDLKTHQVTVEGHAILFERTIAAPMPSDLPENLALAVCDVAGAPALVYHHTRPGNTVVLVGAGGKAGVLCCVAARKKLGRSGKIIAIEPSPRAAQQVRELGVADAVLEIDATNPLLVAAGVEEASRGKMGHIVVNVASVPATELGCILAARSRAKIIYFGMATSFTRVSLGAEGVVSDAQCFFGNGYFPGHSAFAIELVRKHKKLRELFLQRYS